MEKEEKIPYSQLEPRHFEQRRNKSSKRGRRKEVKVVASSTGCGETEEKK